MEEDDSQKITGKQNNGMQNVLQGDDISDKLNLLPDSVYEALFMEKGTTVNMEIIDRFGLNSEQIHQMLNIDFEVAFKEIKMEDLSGEIEKRMQMDGETARQVALELLTKKFFLAKDFFPGIEDAIVKMGGKVPQEVSLAGSQFLKREEQIEEMQEQEEAEEQEKMEDIIVDDTIDNLMAKYPEAGEMVIGAQNSITVKNMPAEMKPMVKYWIQDFKEKVGYYRHTNLERIQYVCHDKNTRNMNEEERRELNLVLKSADGEITLPYSTKSKKIDFSLVKEEE